MKQNMSKTAAIFNAALDLLINIGSIYLAIVVLDNSKNYFGGTTVAISTACAVASVILYFICDM